MYEIIVYVNIYRVVFISMLWFEVWLEVFILVEVFLIFSCCFVKFKGIRELKI